MKNVDQQAHARDLLAISRELHALIELRHPLADDITAIFSVVGQMGARINTPLERGTPEWLSQRWELTGNNVYTDTGELIATTAEPFIAEYMVTTHHAFRDIPYAGGQLELTIDD